jgi:hypothetical protein
MLFYFFDFSPFKGLLSKTLLWLVGRVLVLAGSLDLVSVDMELRFYFRGGSYFWLFFTFYSFLELSSQPILVLLSLGFKFFRRNGVRYCRHFVGVDELISFLILEFGNNVSSPVATLYCCVMWMLWMLSSDVERSEKMRWQK